MSIDTKQIIHIASEVVIIGSLTAFFINKTSKLSEQIDELSLKIQEQNNIIQQQNEIIQKHDNLILRLLNTVNVLVQENGKTTQQQCIVKQPDNKKVKEKIYLNIPVNQPLSKPKQKSTPLPQTIDSSKKVLIMLPTIQSTISTPVSSNFSRVEEINDDDVVDSSSAILDEEIEAELKELDEELDDEELDDEEIDENPRSRSAKLRIIEKIK